MIKVGILTLSDKGFKGEREDKSGKLLKTLVEKEGWLVEKYLILPDEKEKIVETLKAWTDEARLDLILTNGGTGVYPRDVTPEATREVIEKEIPGIPEFIRYISYPLTPMAALTRGVAGVRGKTLIINLPGSPKAIEEIFPNLIAIIKHAVEKIKGDPSECARG
ncbi:MogA/MoaB family molybdenum cofactor biosynthesis protein [Thermodesulfobacterium sp. TA1]|uniref:MogA/MoaB family molybdenum cofactor biosynthesis protein n=1 Tax=Thermodesulfobacterium sp. TA1 TaxID=2234087 RepID=UPI001232142A|nr:MogA/MoaB family molybdenum cofactor biosynthesis protein [Thermodesulfobacterium sp. TA1]QER42239.1 MogA/MoaB family molybdenum cofactor biosynthesis protein [Thermodesulfobacterium sp. TA1]